MMRLVQICMRYPEKSMELTLEDVDQAEVEIEHLISHILLEFFEEILVDEVSILSPAGEGAAERDNLLFIRAHCTIKSPPFQQRDDDFLALTLEGCVSCALAELVGEVDVEQVSVNV